MKPFRKSPLSSVSRRSSKLGSINPPLICCAAPRSVSRSRIRIAPCIPCPSPSSSLFAFPRKSISATELTPPKKGGYNCGESQPWPLAYAPDINDGRKYLQGIGDNSAGGGCSTGPGCARISCSYGSAIFFCSDVSYPLTNYSFPFSFVSFLITPLFIDGVDRRIKIC